MRARSSWRLFSCRIRCRAVRLAPSVPVSEEIVAEGYVEHFYHLNDQKLYVTPRGAGRGLLVYELWPLGEIYRDVFWDDAGVTLAEPEYVRQCVNSGAIRGTRSGFGYTEWMPFAELVEIKTRTTPVTFELPSPK